MKSTTYFISGIVMELSAILVATITFLRPLIYAVDLKARSYSSWLNEE